MQKPLLKSIIGVFIFAILQLLFITVAQSDDVKVAAVVTPRHIQFNERATLELTISGKTLIKNIGIPQFDFLPEFLAVPLQTKTTPHLVDDKVAVTMAWAFELIPQRIGEIALSDIRFSYQGVPYIANPGKIIVGAVDTYHHTSTGGIHKVEVNINNKNPYLNEAVEYRFRYLYTTVLPTLDPPTYQLPEFTDFVAEKAIDGIATSEDIRGKTYQVQESVIRMYPQTVGKILIKPTELKLPIKGTPKILKTKSIALNVQPLPVLGKPANFNGAVGLYTISAHVDRVRLEVRKALTLSLQITGEGNINTVKPLRLSSLNGFRIEPPKRIENNKNKGINFSYVIIPLKAGILQIPSIELSYFNPSNNTYQTSKSQPIPITVLPNSTTIDDTNQDSILPTLWLVLIPLLACVVIGGYLYYTKKLSPKNETTQSDVAATLVGSINTALEALESTKIDTRPTSLGEQITKILHQYLCQLQGTPFRQLNATEIQSICQHLGLTETTISELLDILNKCEYLRFAPVPLTIDERNALITRTEDIIQNIDTSYS